MSGVTDLEQMSLSVLVRWYLGLVAGDSVYIQGHGQLRERPADYVVVPKEVGPDGYEEYLEGQMYRHCCLGVVSDIGEHARDCAFQWVWGGSTGDDHSEDPYLNGQMTEWTGLTGEGAADPIIAFDDEGGAIRACNANDMLEWSFGKIADCVLGEIRRRVAAGS